LDKLKLIIANKTKELEDPAKEQSKQIDLLKEIEKIVAHLNRQQQLI